jgi:hypothetical protein
MFVDHCKCGRGASRAGLSKVKKASIDNPLNDRAEVSPRSRSVENGEITFNYWMKISLEKGGEVDHD